MGKKTMIADEVERIAEQLARKGFGPEWAARMGIAAKLAAALDARRRRRMRWRRCLGISGP
jgi:hypothetical protein